MTSLLRPAGAVTHRILDALTGVLPHQVPGFDGPQFRSIAKSQVDLNQDADSDQEAEKARREQDRTALLTWLQTALSEHV